MVKTNNCLKRCFFVLSGIIGIIGGLILAMAVFGHGAYHMVEGGEKTLPGLIILTVIGGVMIVLSLFGVYTGQKKKKWALILFCIGTSLLCLAFLVISVRQAFSRTAVEEAIKAHYKNKTPLDEADPNTKTVLEIFQKKWQCCGLEQGYQDWGENVPKTCLCPDYYKNSSKCIEVHFQHRPANESEAMVYSEPCIPFVVTHLRVTVNIILGITFGIAFIMMIAVVITMALLCQIRRGVTTTPVTFNVNSSNSRYAELPDCTENI